MKTYKIIILAIMMAAGIFQANAQNSQSPYSRIGYGILGENATGTQRQMGGVGYAMPGGRQINVMNPATYANVDSLTYLWDIGLDLSLLSSKENGNKGNFCGGGLDYIAGAFKITKNIGASFGVIPYSSVGYSFGTDITNGSEERIGEGAINELYAGVAYSPIKNLSIGANVSYRFGDIYNYTYIYGTSTTIFTRQMEIRDWNIHLGAQYTYEVSKKDRATIGVTYSPKKSFRGNTFGTYYDGENDSKLDTVGYTSLNGKYEQPNTFGIGLSYAHGNQWMAEIDFTYQDWAKAKYTTLENFEQANTKFDNRWKVAAGLQYIPDYRGSYLKRVTYRLGAHFNHGYQNISGNNVRDYGIAFGFGFPALGSKSVVNLGFEWNHRFTTPTKLISENYFNITLGVTFNEMWFWKNKLR